MRDVDQGWNDLLNRLPSLRSAYTRQKRAQARARAAIGLTAFAVVAAGLLETRHLLRSPAPSQPPQRAITKPPPLEDASGAKGGEDIGDAPARIEKQLKPQSIDETTVTNEH
jgi:hypothetical protein